MLPPETLQEASRVLAALRARGWRVATAESCTGGLIAAALTHVAGSSDVVDRGFITYSNEAKTELLGISDEVIALDGAVSEAVARAMAEGAVARSLADIAVSVTGIAGPGGGSRAKPVGLVWFGCARAGGPTLAASQIFPGDRAQIRALATAFALLLLRDVSEAGSATLM